VVLVTMPWFIKSMPPTVNENLMLAFLGIIQIGLGYALFTYGQRRIPAIESSLIAMLEPIFNPIWVMIGYHEFPSVWSLIGGGVIISALSMRMIYLRRKYKEASSVP